MVCSSMGCVWESYHPDRPNVIRKSRQRKRHDGVAHLALHLAVAARADDDVLPTVPLIGHRSRLRARRKLDGPELFAGIGVECAQVRILGGGGEDETARRS